MHEEGIQSAVHFLLNRKENYKHGKTNQNPNRPAASTPTLQLPFKKHVYLITCQYTNCGAQYVGYTMTELHERLFEYKQMKAHYQDIIKKSPTIQTRCTNTQAPTNEPNSELWLKQKEYYWICKLGTLTKFNPKGLNILIYDPTFRTQT